MKLDIQISRILRSSCFNINISTVGNKILFLMLPEFYSMFENYTTSYLLQTSKNQVLNHMWIFQCLCCSKESVKSPCVIFHNMPVYLGKGLLASHQIPKLKDHPLSAICDSLFDIFTVTLHVQWLSIPPTNSEQVLVTQHPLYMEHSYLQAITHTLSLSS